MYMMDCILPFVESVLKSLQVAGSESLPHLPTGIEHSVPPLHIPSPLHSRPKATLPTVALVTGSGKVTITITFILILFHPYPILSLSYSILILLTSLITL